MSTADDKMTAHREVLKATYRTFANDFLTVGAFADWLGVADADAQVLIDMGRRYQNEDATVAKTETEASANLIAAAPDLLTALRTIREFAALQYTGSRADIYRIADAAIAKVEG